MPEGDSIFKVAQSLAPAFVGQPLVRAHMQRHPSAGRLRNAVVVDIRDGGAGCCLYYDTGQHGGHITPTGTTFKGNPEKESSPSPTNQFWALAKSVISDATPSASSSSRSSIS